MERTRTTLASAFDPRNNSLNALRLLFASLVIVSHAWPLGGFGDDPSIGDVSLGGWAVAGFFAISGFLIAGSRVRSPFVPFIWRRILRIFPGLWLCLLVTALVFAPIATLAESGANHITVGSLANYLVANGSLSQGTNGIGETLRGVPYPGSWNGSLWTLFYEFGCYLALGGLLTLSRIREKPERLTVVFAACVAITIAHVELVIGLPDKIAWGAYLGTYFFAGAMLFIYAGRVRPSAFLATVAVAVVASHRPGEIVWA